MQRLFQLKIGFCVIWMFVKNTKVNNSVSNFYCASVKSGHGSRRVLNIPGLIKSINPSKLNISIINPQKVC